MEQPWIPPAALSQPAPPAAFAKPAATFRVVHRALNFLTALTLAASEVGKTAWARFLNRGYGYWWVGTSGFSVGDTGCGGLLLDSAAVLLLALVISELVLEATERLTGPALALAARAALAVLLCALAIADIALAVGAGGARVSLPLVLFVVSEPQYVANVVSPWLHIVAASAAGVALFSFAIGSAMLRLLIRGLPQGRSPWLLKLAAATACAVRLYARRQGGDAVSPDLLSRLACDAAAILRGSLKLSPTSDVLNDHLVKVSEQLERYPPLLLYHWEAGSANLLEHALAWNSSGSGGRNAAPFLRSIADQEDAIVSKAFATVPMTLKSAWEVLCGTPPALTSDFREHSSSLRRECLPRVLSRCCGYHSILAKTDKELPELPRRVFGFDEVVVAPSNVALLAKLHSRLRALGGLTGDRPVLVYFYAGDAHTPYTPDRVAQNERGYSSGDVEDVFLALSRRSDDAARELSRFWPPPRSPGAPWRRENGLAIYFGDHGELLWEASEPPPHGNSVAPEVTQVLLAVEGRSFAAPPATTGGGDSSSGSGGGGSAHGRRSRLLRLADVFSTVVDVVGLAAEGPLHVGESLLREGRRQEMASFSFYRPDELVALHYVNEAGALLSLQFSRMPGGWAEIGDMRECETGATLDALAHCSVHNSAHLGRLKAVLADREEVVMLITESNVHAAWMFARLRVTVRQVVRFVLGKLLPAPSDECSVSASAEHQDLPTGC
eukprot:CAMPEP_0203902414 /NCGR_PEP_ID=MMETSP0359-20131031/44476_1 /ASSEMBLY_ACC=CAM_ASM_000338 /TAXON_ID=268821 /ORGANISM="Scrippsiella Hangoei, Strain SHTV-5" /LENGTH=725 /DNA_ID=CAMNT_0050826261 /DNA_START=32 /DNA_END=2209 /DNA_ORIENTATION=-